MSDDDSIIVTPLPPGSMIGIIGCGQLGRMLVLAAAQLGYPCHVYGREPLGPAGQVAAHFTEGEYDDAKAIAAFAAECDVVTYEWENLPVNPLAALGPEVDLFPGVRPLEVGQSRLAEKTFVAGLGGLTAPFAPVRSEDELTDALDKSGVPAIIKSDRMGYDGKGQVRLQDRDDLSTVWQELNGQQALAEGFVEFDAEFSVLLVRGRDGAIRFWDAPHNVHEDGILRLSTAPAPENIQTHIPSARALARKIATELDYVGVLAIEFFATAEGPIFNEMAPRVHNSGHWTIEGAATSQFENHIRAICGLPLGDTRLIEGGAEMRNLIGDEVKLWSDHLSDSGSHVHLYGKRQPRPGRKMGHVTRLLPIN
ncbi:5-(carboxyamino)imidazole ribonucleotide synthase [Alterisphingorhabdus coralli]|uniref:N5-carboxyaminoimidazole ribonucleotide synthase n=1 Tax=Alterisphingorhabdus coralli TaxID=3071408 RepID=A0AA97F7H2_9SPHN|nr:5-(carboxyamino)imidazole ribonucleotide synthase [Parasphingorhabdus sp. SCSIO 66989]WOE75596.1 5-(carboxyamino)imidazole ribonucleotide synthase [Parasphingorhabdus sp. SCSIO 66989]